MANFNHLLKIACLSLMSSIMLINMPVYAQNQYKPVKNGTDLKAVKRDLSRFPLTAVGDSQFNSFIGSQSFSSTDVVERPAAGAVVGQYNYSFSDTRSDLNSTPFIARVAPVITSASRSAPRRIGNYYNFSPQQALNTALLGRIPPFQTVSSKIIVYPGINFENPTEKGTIFTRGFNSVAENVNRKTTITGNNYQSAGRGVFLVNGYGEAQVAANEVPSGPARELLQRWTNGGDRWLIDDEVAGKALGRTVYNGRLNNTTDWADGNTILGFCPDFEVFTPSPYSGNDIDTQWQNMVAYTMLGVKEAAQNAQKPQPMFIPYDWANITPPVLGESGRLQPASGVFTGDGPTYHLPEPEIDVPMYMHPSFWGSQLRGNRSTPLIANGLLGQYIKNNPSAIGSQEYIHYTGDDQTYFQTNPDGSLIIDTDSKTGRKVLRWRTDERTTTAFGQEAHIGGAGGFYNSEYFNLINETYERVAQAIAAQYFRAGGKHLPMSTDRQPGWEQLKLVQWFRFDREFKDAGLIPYYPPIPNAGSVFNTEQLYAPMLSRDVMVHYIFRDVLRFWMEGQCSIVTQGQPGTFFNSDGTTNPCLTKSYGSIEVVSNALYRASRLDYIHNSDTPWQLICPRFWIKENLINQPWFNADEAFEKKPLMIGGIVPNQSKLWMLWSYPAQDVNKTTEVSIWIDKGNGEISSTYKILLSGRETGLDDWSIPQNFANAKPEHIRFQFTDLTNEKQTWCGDYRATPFNGQNHLYNNHPTPPSPVATITGESFK